MNTIEKEIQKLKQRLARLEGERAKLNAEEPEDGTPGFILAPDGAIPGEEMCGYARCALSQGNWFESKAAAELERDRRAFKAKYGGWVPECNDMYDCVTL